MAILFSIIADGFACVPTIIKSFNKPETESARAYFFGVVNAVIGLLVIRTWNFENYAYIVYLLAASSILVILIQFKVGKLIHISHK